MPPLKGLGVYTTAYPAFRAKRRRSMLGYPVPSRRRDSVVARPSFFAEPTVIQGTKYLFSDKLLRPPDAPPFRPILVKGGRERICAAP